MPLSSDFKDMLKILNEEKVKFLIVGAHAVGFYSVPRFTKDFDIWISPTEENAGHVWNALKKFGAPLSGLTPEDFSKDKMVYQMGVPPFRIDIVMGIDGLLFDEAWPNRVESDYDGEPFFLPSKGDLIKNKKASGRPQDLLDVERLLKGKESRPR